MSFNWSSALGQGPKYQKVQPVAGAAGGLAAGIMGAISKPDAFGRSSAGLAGASKGLELAATGSQFGLIGAGVGLLAGFAGGFFSQRKANREGDMAEYQYNLGQKQDIASNSANAYNNMSYGTTWGKNGGPLSIPFKKTMRIGGQLQPLNSNTELAQGRKHSQGGIFLSEYGAEIEDDETIYHSPQGPYVFSDYLRDKTGKTYADTDKKAARSLKRLEMKPKDPLRDMAMKMTERNRMKAMEEQEIHRKLYEQQLLKQQA